MPVKKILVPVDFSDCSINALKYAVAIAKRMNAELLIMNAFYVPLANAELDGSAAIHGLATDIDHDIKKNFMSLELQAPELTEVTYETITKYALLKDAITSYYTTSDVDLIIMGTKGAKGIDEIINGTNTYSVIKSVKCPVLSVPDQVKFTNLKKIGLACDYKLMNERVLRMLTLLAKLFRSEIHIFHVSDDGQPTPHAAEQAKKLERYFKNIQHKYNLVVNDDIEKGVEEYVEENSIDLLTIIPRKHNVFNNLLGIGESKSIIFHSRTPLLTLPQ